MNTVLCGCQFLTMFYEEASAEECSVLVRMLANDKKKMIMEFGRMIFLDDW